jgi:hypothetical protein
VLSGRSKQSTHNDRGDSAWALFVDLSEDQARTYLAARRSQGCNAACILVSNDDGIYSPGIAALAEVATDSASCGSSHLTSNNPSARSEVWCKSR